MRGEVAIGPSIYGVYVIDGSLCSRVYGIQCATPPCEHALMTHPVHPRSFGMKFIALSHVTTYNRPVLLVVGPGNEAKLNLPDIRFCREYEIHQRLESHPFGRKWAWFGSLVLVHV